MHEEMNEEIEFAGVYQLMKNSGLNWVLFDGGTVVAFAKAFDSKDALEEAALEALNSVEPNDPWDSPAEDTALYSVLTSEGIEGWFMGGIADGIFTHVEPEDIPKKEGEKVRPAAAAAAFEGKKSLHYDWENHEILDLCCLSESEVDPEGLNQVWSRLRPARYKVEAMQGETRCLRENPGPCSKKAPSFSLTRKLMISSMPRKG
jgi:hypothetical protein